MDRIQFEHVSKRYLLGENTNAREAIALAARRLFRSTAYADRELWSLRDVSFSIQDGESVGIIGRNGAGKSTILKILARITSPTEGVSRTRGRVAALLEVGTGFHPELTGTENIYLNGAILGMTRRDIKGRFDQIVEFAGTQRFLDTPLKRYSSGMQLRLAFAVAAHLEPDILIVDEVLAVGDAEFQRRCIGRMAEAEREGRTVVFVSHDLNALTRLCYRSIWLESGAIRQTGTTRTVVRDYLASGLSTADGGFSLRTDAVTVHAIRVTSSEGEPVRVVTRHDPIRIELSFELTEEVPSLDLAIFVTTSDGIRVLDEALRDKGLTRLSTGMYRAELSVPPILNVGDFTIGIWFGTRHEDIVHEPAAAHFTVSGTLDDRPERLVALNLPLTVRSLNAPG